MLNFTGAGNPASLRCRCKGRPYAPPPPFLPGLLFHSGKTFYLRASIARLNGIVNRVTQGLTKDALLPSKRFFFVKRGTDPESPGFTSRCTCPEYYRLLTCIHINLVEKTFTDFSSPWVASLPAEGRVSDNLRTDFRIERMNGRVFDTIDCSVLDEWDCTGRSSIITKCYSEDDFPARAFKIKAVVHSAYHGDLATISG